MTSFSHVMKQPFKYFKIAYFVYSYFGLRDRIVTENKDEKQMESY